METYYIYLSLLYSFIGIILAGLLLAYGIKFNKNQNNRSLYSFILINMAISLLEILVIIGWVIFRHIYGEMALPTNSSPADRLFLSILYCGEYVDFWASCALLSTILAYLYRVANDINVYDLKKNILQILFCNVLFINIGRILQLIISTLFLGDANFVFTFDSVNFARVSLWVGLIIYSIYVLKFKKNNPEACFSARAVLLSVLMGFLVVTLQRIILPLEWVSDSLLNSMSFMVAYSLINSRLMIQTKQKEAVQESEIGMASDIRISELPAQIPAFPNNPDIDLQFWLKNVGMMAGDFYDYFELDETHAAFMISNISGKDTPAALCMMTAKYAIKTIASSTWDTGEILSKANDVLAENNNAVMFASVWLGILDTKTLELEYTNAGNPCPFIITGEGNKKPIEAVHGIPLGISAGTKYGKGRLNLNRDDIIVLHSNGLLAVPNLQDQLYDEDRLVRLITNNRQKSCEELKNLIVDDVAKFSKGASIFEDITIMIVHNHQLSQDKV